MAGLILAGLGRGISDAATTYGNFMAKEADDKRRREEEALREERLAEREDRRAELKMQQEIDREERKSQRIASDTAKIGQMAADAPVKRDAGLIASLARNVGGDAPAASEEEIAQLIRENPQYRDVYRQAGYITDKTDPRLQRVEDEAAAAGSIGAYSAVVDAISKKRESVLALIREENKDAREEKKNAITIARDERRFEIQERNAETAARRVEAIAARAAGGGDGGKDGPASKLDNQAENLRKAIAQELDPARQQRLKDQYDEVLADIRALRKPGAANKPAAEKTAPAQDKGGDNKAPAKPQIPADVAQPKSMAEFEKLPKGARFYNPADQKIYTKK